MKKLIALAVLAVGILTFAPVNAEAGYYCSSRPRVYTHYYNYDYGYYRPYRHSYYNDWGWTRPVVHRHYHGCGHHGWGYIY